MSMLARGPKGVSKTKVSAPLPPVSVSLPSPPFSLSLKELLNILSSLAVPVIVIADVTALP